MYTYILMFLVLFINPQCACAARVTVVGSVCLSVNQNLFFLKRISRTQSAMKVKIFVWISLKPLRCRDTPLPALYGYLCSRPFWKMHMRFNSACIFMDPRTRSTEGSAL